MKEVDKYYKSDFLKEPANELIPPPRSVVNIDCLVIFSSLFGDLYCVCFSKLILQSDVWNGLF